MSEQMILPGQGNSKLDTSNYTSQDFKSEIQSDNIRSTFFKEEDDVEFPCVCIDLSKTGVILKTSMEALKQLLIPEEKLIAEEKVEADKDSQSIKSTYDEKIGVYLNTSGNKKVRIGYMREHTARHLLPHFIKSTFPSETVLYITEDGIRVEEFKKTTLAGVKLEFNY